MDADQRTLDVLDWDVLRRALAERARTPMGARAAARLAPLPDVAGITTALDAVDELERLAASGIELPIGGVGDIAATVRRAEKGEVLEPAALREAGQSLWALADTVGALLDTDVDVPVLSGLAQAVQLDPELLDALETAFDPEGRLSDVTFPQLYGLRQQVRDLEVAIRRTLEDLLRGDELEDVLQDRFVTQRDNRYVLPIKAHAKRWDLGIVHGTSGSGATVFVEPRQVVDLNNRLRIAEGELEAEERRILAALSRSLGACAEAVREALAIATEIDLAVARHALALTLDATRPTVAEDGVVALRAARHPVLVLRGVDVVANDLAVRPGQPALVLTGPNTGGKTVALKTVGLCALLVAVGCRVPAAKGSRVDRFALLRAEIGDAQTVSGDLSSFSAQMVHVRDMLARAGPDALLLLDEIGAGTDPAQGGALARAILEALVERGARVVVTTHHAQIKGLGAVDPRFGVAAMEYRDERPTYRVLPGAAGESHALGTARRMGIPAAITERASALMGESERALSEALAGLERERARAAEEARAARALREDLAVRERELAAREERIAGRSREIEAQGARAYLERLKRAERAVAEVVAELQRTPSHAGVEAARTTLGALRDLVPEEVPPPPATVPSFAPGDPVRVRRLGRTGEVVGVGDGVVQVRSGGVVLRVRPGELEATPRARRPVPRDPVAAHTPAPPAAPEQAVRLPGNTLDLRGMRVDEGLEAVEHYLDRAAARGTPVVFLLHGHGTGALKQAIRQWLPDSPAVRRWAPAGADQGGDAYTVVVLA